MNIELIRKALTEGNTLSAIATPELDKTIADLMNYNNPLRNMIPRKKASGSSVVVVRRAPTSANAAQWVADNENITEATGTYMRVEFHFKTLAARGRISRKLIQEGIAFKDIAAEEINFRVNELKVVEEDAIINANAFEEDPAKPLGAIKQLQSAGRIVTDGVTQLSLSLLDKLIDSCKGKLSMLVMNQATRRKLNSLLQAYQRWVDKTEVAGGFRVLTYNDIPIIVSDAVRNDYSYDANTGKVIGVGEVANPTTVILALNVDEFFISELTPVTLLPLAKTSSQYDEFDIYEDIAIVLRDYTTCAILTGIQAS